MAAESRWPGCGRSSWISVEEARARALQGLEDHRAGDVRRVGEAATADERQGSRRRHELRAVDEREPLLRLERDGLEPRARERLGAGELLALERRAAPRRRAASARCASGARSPEAPTEPRLGTTGTTPRFRQASSRSTISARAPEWPLGEDVRAQEHRRTNDLGRVRVADAAGVAPEKPELELGAQLGRDRLRDEPAEARVDPVGVLALDGRDALDELACGGELAASLVGELGLRTADGDCPDVPDRQIVAGQRHCGRERHRRKCSERCRDVRSAGAGARLERWKGLRAGALGPRPRRPRGARAMTTVTETYDRVSMHGVRREASACRPRAPGCRSSR